MRHDRHTRTETTQIVEESHRRTTPPSVQQRPVLTLPVYLLDHWQERSDADPAGNKEVVVALDQREVVTRAGNPDGHAWLKHGVHVLGPAAAVRLEKDGYRPLVPHARIAAKRILANEVAAQHQVNVRATGELR